MWGEVDRWLTAVLGEVLGPAGGEIVDHHHGVATIDQQIDDVAADEAGPSGDDGARHRSGQPRSLDRLHVVVANIVEGVRDPTGSEGRAEIDHRVLDGPLRRPAELPLDLLRGDVV